MKKRILFFALLLLCILCGKAQKKAIELQPQKPHRTMARLIDEAKTEDNFLLNFPITLTLTDNNILFIMMGNDTALLSSQTVLIFSEEMNLADLLKKDLNIKPNKGFDKQYPTLNPVVTKNKNIRLFRQFDDGYEFIKKNAKPLFVEITNAVPNTPIRLSLQFYVAQSNNLSYLLAAKCKPIDLEIVIKQ